MAQINGKVRGKVDIDASASKDDILRQVREHANVRGHLEGKTILKEIYVPGKLVNFVVK